MSGLLAEPRTSSIHGFGKQGNGRAGFESSFFLFTRRSFRKLHGRFHHHEQFYLDSEWHSFLECPLVRSPRREFVLLTKLHTFFENDCSVENFALLVARVREDKHLVNALARFARQIHDSRQCWFRQLSSEATKQRLAEMLETRFNI